MSKPAAPFTEENKRMKQQIAALESELCHTRNRISELEQLYKMAPVGMCLVDINNRFILINQHLADINGRSVEDHIGATIREVLPEIADIIEDLHQQVFTTGEPILNVEIVGATPADPTNQRYYMVSYLPVKDKSGCVTGISTVVQNVDDLKQAELHEVSAQEKLKSVLTSVSECVWSATVDISGNFKHRYLSPVVEKITGRPVEFFFDNLSRWIEIIYPEDQRFFITLMNRVINQEVSKSDEEYRLVLPDGSVRWIRDNVSVKSLSDGSLQLDGVVSDITMRKRSDENFLKLVLESIEDGVVVADENGKFAIFNPAAQRIIGIGANDIPPEQWAENYGIFLPDGKTPCSLKDDPLMRAVRGETVEPMNLIFRNENTAGDVLINVSSSPLFGPRGELKGGVVVFRDITQQHRNELKLKAEEDLLRKMLELQENERKLIANEIHDGLMQDIFGAKMIVESVLLSLEQNSDAVAELNRMVKYLQKATTEGRRLINDVRPLIVDDEGIIAAIKYLVAEQDTLSGIVVDFQYNVQFNRLEPKLESSIFRIVQEALNNIKRHSRVKQAVIRIEQAKDMLNIEIQDQGVGFDKKKVPISQFGLRGMQERARLFGGHTKIISSLGNGTQVVVKIPVLEWDE